MSEFNINIIPENDPEHISIYKGRSNVELSRLDNTGQELAYMISAATSGPVFYFNRIRTFPEGQGIGTEIMEQLVNILDQHNITGYCELNPYGTMGYQALEKFYKKFGFEDYGEKGSLIRTPRKMNNA